jgi:quinol monooxygenase YgiN
VTPPELLVVSLLTPRKGSRDTVIAMLREELPQCHGEPGVVRFALHEDHNDPRRLIVIEAYRHADDLEAHYTTPYFAKIAEELPPLLDGPVQIIRAVPVPVGVDPKSTLALGGAPADGDAPVRA